MTRAMWIIARREFRTRVRSKVFLFMTVAFPVFMMAITMLPTMFRGGGNKRWVIVDDAPASVGLEVTRELAAAGAAAEHRRARLDEVRIELNGRVRDRAIDGYLSLPADLLDRGEVAFRGRSVANVEELHEIGRVVTDAVRRARLERAGVARPTADQALEPVKVETSRITSTGEEARSDALSSFMFAYVIAMSVFMLIIVHGNAVMRSVLEEKSSRVVEVILSSVDARALMLGKIVGVAAVAMLQVGIWALAGFNIVRRAQLLDKVHIDAQMAPVMLMFLVLGFLLYAAIFAAVGAAVSSEQEAHQIAMVPQLIAVSPVLMLLPITSDPLGPLARTFGLIPLTAPVVMPLRLGAAQVPALEIALSMVILAASVTGAAVLAGKIYRVGVLSTGRRPTLRELLRWMKR